MEIERILVSVALVGLLAGCEPEEGPRATWHSGSATASPSGVASRVDPTATGCTTLRSLGGSATPAQYRDVAAVLTGSSDARLSAAAVRLHDATGSSLAQPDKIKLHRAVLDVAEQCLRVVG